MVAAVETPASSEQPSGNGTAPPKVVKGKRPTPARPKSALPLPTERIQYDNQTKLIRAYAIASGPEGRGVTNGAVANIVKMHSDTVALANGFFTGIGILQRTDSGFVPAPEVIAFNRAFEWNPESAGTKLSPLMERAWFGQALLPRLRLAGTMEEREAIQVLAETAAVPPQQKKNLELILDYMTTSGLIQREGGMIKMTRQTAQQPAPPAGESQDVSENRSPAPASSRSPQSSPLASALFPSSADGMVQFHISVRVNMAEFAGWTPDRISAFFSGVAQVLAARGKDELPEVQG
jgi:hypothetical protein